MLKAPAAFPYVGSFCYFDDHADDGSDIVEKARIQRDNGDGTALLSIASRRFSHEVASGNRTMPFAQLRECEQAAPVVTANDQVTKRRRQRAR